MITLKDVINNPEITTYVRMADKTMEAMRYTEHGYQHVGKCANTCKYILSTLNYDERTIELAQIAAFMHDIGNAINRADHAHSGGIMAFVLLTKMGMDAEEIAKIAVAIGNHDEKTAFPVNEIAAALILADKTDVRRSRVRTEGITHIDDDIHDRVNFAAEQISFKIDKEKEVFVLNFDINESISSLAEYFEIFHSRMVLCRKAARYFNYGFEIHHRGNKVM